MKKLFWLLIFVPQVAFSADCAVIYSAVITKADRIVIRPALRSDRVVEGGELTKFKDFMLAKSKASWNPCTEVGRAVIPEFRLIVEVKEGGTFSTLVEFSITAGCFTKGEASYIEFKKYTRDALGIDDIDRLWGGK